MNKVMDGVGIACVALFMYCLTLFAVIFFVGGGIRTLIAIKNKKARIIPLVVFLLGCGFVIYRGSALIPEERWLNLFSNYQFGDGELKPYEHAITEFDRESLGFSSISQEANIKIIHNPREYEISCPDVELFIADLPFKRHYICLRKVGNTYVWDSEYEKYLGPNEWESIWLVYSSRSNTLRLYDDLYHVEPYKLFIKYWGESDARLENRTLTLEYIQPILNEWQRYHEKQSENK